MYQGYYTLLVGMCTGGSPLKNPSMQRTTRDPIQANIFSLYSTARGQVFWVLIRKLKLKSDESVRNYIEKSKN